MSICHPSGIDSIHDIEKWAQLQQQLHYLYTVKVSVKLVKNRYGGL